MSARTVLVTGASAGIGLELSRVFAERGYRVVLVARRAERLEQLAHELRSQGALAETLVADLADPNAPEEMFRETQRRGIDIDILVNNAGYGEEPFGATAWADQARFLQVMLVSLCHLTHLYLPGMKQRGYGRVLNVASLAAFAPVRAGDLYAPIKTFVVRFTQAIDDELVRGEVDVRCVV